MMIHVEMLPVQVTAEVVQLMPENSQSHVEMTTILAELMANALPVVSVLAVFVHPAAMIPSVPELAEVVQLMPENNDTDNVMRMELPGDLGALSVLPVVPAIAEEDHALNKFISVTQAANGNINTLSAQLLPVAGPALIRAHHLLHHPLRHLQLLLPAVIIQP